MRYRSKVFIVHEASIEQPFRKWSDADFPTDQLCCFSFTGCVQSARACVRAALSAFATWHERSRSLSDTTSEEGFLNARLTMKTTSAGLQTARSRSGSLWAAVAVVSSVRSAASSDTPVTLREPCHPRYWLMSHCCLSSTHGKWRASLSKCSDKKDVCVREFWPKSTWAALTRRCVSLVSSKKTLRVALSSREGPRMTPWMFPHMQSAEFTHCITCFHCTCAALQQSSMRKTTRMSLWTKCWLRNPKTPTPRTSSTTCWENTTRSCGRISEVNCCVSLPVTCGQRFEKMTDSHRLKQQS